MRSRGQELADGVDADGEMDAVAERAVAVE
jgi:hypothetical protein